MMALCLHSVFEGLAVGLENDWSQLLSFMFAIIIHKGVAGCALGINLIKSLPDDFSLVRKLVFVFAIATPVGVSIGMLVANAGDTVDVIFSSLAAGTFIYIACTEIIVNEFAIQDLRWWKLLAMMVGAFTIIGLGCMPGA